GCAWVERHPEAVNDAGTLVVEQRELRARRDSAEIDVATGRIRAARVLRAPATGDDEPAEPAGPGRLAHGMGGGGGDETHGAHDGAWQDGSRLSARRRSAGNGGASYAVALGYGAPASAQIRSRSQPGRNEHGPLAAARAFASATRALCRSTSDL